MDQPPTRWDSQEEPVWWCMHGIPALSRLKQEDRSQPGGDTWVGDRGRVWRDDSVG